MRYPKTTFLIGLLLLALCGNIYANQYNSANFLATKGLLVDRSTELEKYEINKNITRKEFVSLIINLSGGTTKTLCEYNYTDVQDDWGCKYIDEAYERGLIEKNEKFYPEKNISRGEALGLTFQAKKIFVTQTDPWQQGYFDSAVQTGLMQDEAYSYDSSAKRGWIFDIMAKTFPEYKLFVSSGRTQNTTESNVSDNREFTITKDLIDGELEGDYIEYFDNGNIKVKNNYRTGVLHGETAGYYYDGTLNFEGTYNNGRLQGLYMKYYDNGNIAFREYYDKGLLSGICEYYTEAGLVARTREYIGGYLLREF